MSESIVQEATVVAVIQFKLKDRGAGAEMIEAMEQVCDLMKVQPGFIDERLVQVSDGETYVDIVRWQSREDVEKAGDVLQSSQVFGGLMALTDPDSVEIQHGRLALEVISRSSGS